ncbi:MAG: tRNA uridine-5-carboxymethylaminomethyl(34) synthesis GTPase MnmE [Victivallaceae bacterium]
MNTSDTICAPATAIGGAITVIRISGGRALEISRLVWRGRQSLSLENRRRMLLGNIIGTDNEVIDQAMAVYMPGPWSYTGDDVVELQCHGGALTARKVLKILESCGARPAEAGEFTFRAFINGKLDLTQSEAVCDVISAGSDLAHHLAERQLAGVLGRSLSEMRGELVDILAECESRLDFSEENLDWQSNELMLERLRRVDASVRKLIASGRGGIILREGVRVVLAGRPNAGKSSLLNLLLGFDRAIVTEQAGTTRDTIEEQLDLRGIPVKLIDTAGLRDSDNQVEFIGIERARQSLASAQVIFYLIDAAAVSEADWAEMHRALAGKKNVIVIWNKSDLPLAQPVPDLELPVIKFSTATGEGLDALLDKFAALVWADAPELDNEMAVNSRHLGHLMAAEALMAELYEALELEEYELCALQLRRLIDELGAITGENVEPDVLENIFSRFCIGK